MTDDQPTNAKQPRAQREQCSECGTVLVHDQRYCLQCGARRGKPRIDFTAFWRSLSATDAEHGPREPQGVDATSGRSPLTGQAPSRRVVGTLAAGVLAVGIIAGAALGPAPASSTADSSTLAQRALAALVTRASSSSQAATPPSSAAPSSASEAATKTPTSDQVKAQSKAISSEASTPASPQSTSPGEEPTTSTPSSKTSPSSGEGNSKGEGEGEKTAPGTPVKLPPIKHVWLISLSGESFANALAQPDTDPYLAKQLVPQGTLLSGYTLSASSELANGLALLSGQSVNLDTEQNCPTYAELQPPTINAANGLAEGVGCVYPATVQTLADELTAAGLTWKAYVQGMQASTTTAAGSASAAATGTSPPAGTTTPAQAPATAVSCRHPELGATDPDQAPTLGDPYLTFRNPFVYFHSLLDGGACASDDVDLSQLQSDLAAPAGPPSLSWIVPSACDDGSSSACAPGSPAGLGPADGFLKETVTQILATTAYRKQGLIVIVPDSAPTSPAGATTKPAGALLISPFVHSGARVSESFNDFSLLKSLARLFGVLPLGHANDPSAVSFGASVYDATK